MIVNVNPRGHSFKGVTAYLLHDKGADTSERVLWTSTHNLHTDDVEKAARFMAWTDRSRDGLRENKAGAKASAGNVYHFSLSRTAKASEGQDWMAESAHAAIRELKLEGHQYYLVAHNDTEHEHVHAVVSLVNPQTGKIAQVRGDFKTLDRWANEFEKVHGLECENRARKYEAWEQDQKAFPEKSAREERAQAVSDAFHHSDGAQAFQAALGDHGLTLARGNRRGLVVVDRSGDVYALNRLIEFEDGTKGRAKTKRISEHLSGLHREGLEDADVIAAQRKHFDRDAAEVAQQNALAEAAEDAAEGRVEQDRAREAKAGEEKRQADRKAWLQKRTLEREQQRKAAIHRADLTLRRKCAESRSRWQIDELTKARDAARDDLGKLDGFWSRIFKRKAIAEARDRVQDLEKRLAERASRHQDDVQVYREQREAVVSELVEHRSDALPPDAQKQAFLERRRLERERAPQEPEPGHDHGMEFS